MDSFLCGMAPITKIISGVPLCNYSIVIKHLSWGLHFFNLSTTGFPQIVNGRYKKLFTLSANAIISHFPFFEGSTTIIISLACKTKSVFPSQLKSTNCIGTCKFAQSSGRKCHTHSKNAAFPLKGQAIATPTTKCYIFSPEGQTQP